MAKTGLFTALTVLVLTVLVACDGEHAALDGAVLDGSVVDGGGGGGDGSGPDASCVAVGVTCQIGAECCSRSCDGNQCVTSNCAGQGLACTLPGDCCSGICGQDGKCGVTGACDPFGGSCTTDDECCSGNCNATGGGACTGSGCSCGPSAGCKAASEACTADSDCCNNLCDRPGGAASGTCAVLGSCRSAGEPCGTEGFNGSCCSTVCLDGDAEGIARCQHLGGCRVQDDLCSFDAECCSGSCAQDGQTLDGRPIKRCANADSCLPVGEVCGGQGSSSNCCPNGGGSTGCEPTGSGFNRCFGGTPGCTLPSGACQTTADCCVESFSNIMCQHSPVTGANACCLADGEICAFGNLCCGGICSPSGSATDPPGTLRCGSTCGDPGDACTVDSDCCDCCKDGTCTTDCGSCTGPQLGELCDPQGPACCNAPAVICQGVEFARCEIAP